MGLSDSIKRNSLSASVSGQSAKDLPSSKKSDFLIIQGCPEALEKEKNANSMQRQKRHSNEIIRRASGPKHQESPLIVGGGLKR